MSSRVTGYGVGGAKIDLAPVPADHNGIPTSLTAYDFGQLIKDKTTGDWYINSGAGVFPLITGASGIVDQLTGDTGVATPIAGNINVFSQTPLIETQGFAGELFISSTASGFPITPFVVGPTGKAGYQTVQLAVTAANAAGGGTVYVQPGTYTESLLWPTGVYICSLPPQSQNIAAALPVTIIGNHSIVRGLGGSTSWGTNGIYFQNTASGNIFSTALTTVLNSTVIDCTIRATSGFIFSMPSIDTSSSSSFTLDNVTVIDGGTFASATRGNVFVNASTLALTGSTPMTLGTGTVLFNESSISEPIVNNSGVFIADLTTFSSVVTINSTGPAGGVFTSCYFTGDTAAVVFNSTSSGSLSYCQLFSGGTYTIDGNGTGAITLSQIVFSSASLTYVNPALTGVVYDGATAQEFIITRPPASSSVTGSFGAVTFGTPKQNTLGYDILVSGIIEVTSATGSVINMAVGPSSTPTGTPITPAFTVIASTLIGFSAKVPAGYYFSLGGSGGAITVASLTTTVTV